ncbi:MAG: hypothetical protein COB20_09305 [SAR86 cluster bacterium]|uniref:ABC transporter permease n=1 Tax=SAR86 cluster bacterium TaxID=2030880 RepID=A0A2A4X2Y3_9GAMM|nr:MAG: hypothetical protein COB20_09305 [SAR86 cluster bacterium]
MSFTTDLNYTWRLIRKKAGFNVLCVVVIALGLCISVVDYYFISAISFKSLDFPNGDRIGLLKVARAGTNAMPVDGGWDAYRYRHVKENSESFSEVGAMELNTVGVVSDGEASERVSTTAITPSLLRMTDVLPILGRNFLDSDDVVGAPLVAIISHRLWESYYNGRTDIVGFVSQINGEPRTIVGVFPPDYKFPYAHDLWLPLQLPTNVEPEAIGPLWLVGLLADNSDFETASNEVRSLLGPLATEFPNIYRDNPVGVTPYVQLNNNGVMPIAYSMLAAMVIIILLSCVNVGNLIWVGTNERYHELLIQTAIGATRWHLIKQVLLESFLVCAMGGIVGIALIAGAMKLFVFAIDAFNLINMPFWIQPELTFQLIAMALSILLFIWLLAGGIPAWKMTRVNKGLVMGGSSKGVPSGGRSRVNDSLIGFEMVTSIFLLIMCGALVLGIQQATRTDYGVNPDNLLSARFTLPAATYPDDSSRLEFIETLSSEIQSLPQISSTTYTTAIPSRANSFLPYQLEGQEFSDERDIPRQFVASVADNYFQELGVELVEGRYFDSGDTADSQQVVIINKLFADSLVANSFVDDSAALLGRRLRIDPQQGSDFLTIIGVTSHIIQSQPIGGQETFTTLYRPYSQRAIESVYLVARTLGDPYLPVEGMKAAAASVDRSIPLYSFESFQDTFFDAMVGLNLIGYLFIAISSVTLLLAASGIYAIVSRSVLQRTQETGIRRALGSSNARAIRRFVRKGLAYLVVAVVLGGTLAALASQAFSVLFPQIVTLLPVVFLTVISIFSFVILASSYLPARKIVAMEPGEALHYE